MKNQWKAHIAAGAALALAAAFGGTALAANSLTRPGEDVAAQLPHPKAAVEDQNAGQAGGQHSVEFTITNFRLEAPELYLDKNELTRILQEGMGTNKTMSQLNVTLNSLTRYCREHGYPAAAAYVPAQESRDGMITIRVIPGRYGAVKFDNQSNMKERVAQGFVNGLKSGQIIRTSNLESALYSLSDISGTRAVGVLSPGKEFGTSDLTVRIEKGKGTNTVLYVENYGSQNSGRYRYGLQENVYDVGGTGGKLSAGTMLSNADMHNYYVNYEALVGHGGTTFGLGYSRMDYKVGGALRALQAQGTADTLSAFGSRPIYHLTKSSLTFTYGYDYRKLDDDITAYSDMDSRKHSHSVHAGITGFERSDGLAVNYEVKATTGSVSMDSQRSRSMDTMNGGEHTSGRYTKGEASFTAVQQLGHRSDVMVKASGQIASHNLDGSEEMYLGGASGVRAYPQGEGSGDEGVLGTIETRFYTNVTGLIASTYLDIGHVRYRNDGGLDSASKGQPSSGETLKGWGIGLAYTKGDDWFARLDYARRIGDDPNLSQFAKARGRTWFMLGKIW